MEQKFRSYKIKLQYRKNSVGITSIWLSEKKSKTEDKENYKTPNYYIKEIPEILNILKR